MREFNKCSTLIKFASIIFPAVVTKNSINVSMIFLSLIIVLNYICQLCPIYHGMLHISYNLLFDYYAQTIGSFFSSLSGRDTGANYYLSAFYKFLLLFPHIILAVCDRYLLTSILRCIWNYCTIRKVSVARISFSMEWRGLYVNYQNNIIAITCSSTMVQGFLTCPTFIYVLKKLSHFYVSNGNQYFKCYMAVDISMYRNNESRYNLFTTKVKFDAENLLKNSPTRSCIFFITPLKLSTRFRKRYYYLRFFYFRRKHSTCHLFTDIITITHASIVFINISDWGLVLSLKFLDCFSSNLRFVISIDVMNKVLSLRATDTTLSLFWTLLEFKTGNGFNMLINFIRIYLWKASWMIFAHLNFDFSGKVLHLNYQRTDLLIVKK